MARAKGTKVVMKGQPESDKYRATRDRELWYLKAEKGKIQACFYGQGGFFKGERVYYCLPAVLGDSVLMDFLESSFRPLVIHPTTEGWMCPEDKVRQLAEKAPGITPSWYNRRPGLNARYADPETCEVTAVNAKFMRRAALRAGLPDPHLMKTMFGWIQQQMVEDLLVHHEPIDLGFAWLVAVPYRPNWKDALSHDADYNLETMRENRAAMFRRLTSLTLTGVKSVGKQPKSPGIPYYGFHWTIEVIPKTQWHRASAEVELKTRTQGGEAHIRNWARIIWELRPKLQQAIEEHALACSLPVGSVIKGVTPKDVELRPYAGSELLKRNGSDSPDPIVWGDGTPPVWTPEGEELPMTVKRKEQDPVNVLDLGVPRTKNLVTIKPPSPSLISGFPSGDDAKPAVEADPVPDRDSLPPPDSSRTEEDPVDDDPYPWSDN